MSRQTAAQKAARCAWLATVANLSAFSWQILADRGWVSRWTAMARAASMGSWARRWSDLAARYRVEAETERAQRRAARMFRSPERDFCRYLDLAGECSVKAHGLRMAAFDSPDSGAASALRRRAVRYEEWEVRFRHEAQGCLVLRRAFPGERLVGWR